MHDFVWKDDYASGVASIDDDHQRFFAIANDFKAEVERGVTPEKVEAVIDELIRHAEDHFDREERYMRRAGYPGYKEHRRKHEALRDVFIGLTTIFHKEPASSARRS